MKTNNLRLIVLENCREFGNLVNDNLKKIRGVNKNYIIPISSSRFSNGEGKMKLLDSVRDKDIYIISDVGNYGMSYKLHGMNHIISPDEHFQDIKRVISATCGHATKINVVMPLLYQSRQHKRKGRESLDCAIALQELEKMGVNNIITFDVHDPNVSNAIPLLPFENFYPTHTILNNLIDKEKFDDPEYYYDLYLQLMYTEQDLEDLKYIKDEMETLSKTLNDSLDKLDEMITFLQNHDNYVVYEENSFYFTDDQLLAEYNKLIQEFEQIAGSSEELEDDNNLNV